MAYLDNSATTAVCDAAVQAMIHCMTEEFGNPSSRHAMGFRAEQVLATVREQVATLIGGKAERVFFTSGGTEANNLAILGTAAAFRKPMAAVTTAVEHPSVAACFDELERQGWQVTRIQPERDGTISVQQVVNACTEDTALVSVMAVNNETGARFDIESMAEEVHEIAPSAIFHTDCVQAAGKLPLKAERWDVDLMTVSSHKIHGPKGCGAIYVKEKRRLRARQLGGGQESGLRSGTEPIPAIVGFGAAASAVMPFAEQRTHYEQLRAVLLEELKDETSVRWHLPQEGVPYIVNFSLPGHPSETVVNFLSERGIYVSAGSACAKGNRSSVLKAMNLPAEEIDSSLRVSFCYENTEDDVRALAKALREAVTLLQGRRP